MATYRRRTKSGVDLRMNEGGEGSERDPGRTERASNRQGQRGRRGAGREKARKVSTRVREEILDEENKRLVQDRLSIRRGALAMERGWRGGSGWLMVGGSLTPRRD